jgi:hypothetical protein
MKCLWSSGGTAAITYAETSLVAVSELGTESFT